MEDGQVTKTKRKRFFLKVIVMLFLLWVTLRLTVFGTSDPGIVFGSDTTYVDATKNPDGTPNYVAWWNRRYSKGVTADNNAAVLILRVLEPSHSASATAPGLTQEELERLGFEQTPESDKIFVTFEKMIAMVGEPKNPKEKTKQAELPDPQDLFGKVWNEKDYPIISRWIDHNQEALDCIVDASTRTHSFMPLFSKSDSPNLYEDLRDSWTLMNALESARDALGLRATRHLHRGDIEAAWSDAMAMHRLGCLFSQDPSVPYYLIGYDLFSKGHAIIVSVVGSGKANSLRAHRFLEDLKTLREHRPSDDWRLTERLHLLDAVIHFRRKSSEKKNFLEMREVDYNLALRYCNSFWNELDNAAKFARPDKQIEIERIFKSAEVGAAKVIMHWILLKFGGSLVEKSYAKTVFGIAVTTAPRISKVDDFVIDSMVRLDLSKTILALAAYKADTGEYPKALDALKPAYLEEIPQDRFTQAPLIYELSDDGYVLYSVGSNGVDDNGVDGKDKDIVVRIPVEEKVKPAK